MPSARNIFAHVLRGRLMRVVPRENEEINETWIADRDRFGFEGIYSRRARRRSPCCASTARCEQSIGRVALTAAARRPAEGAARATAPRASDSWPRRCATRRGDVPARADRPRARQRQHRPSPAPAAISARRSARPRYPELGLPIADDRGARGRARRRLEPAPRGADAGAPHAQGGRQGRRKSGVPEPARASSTCSRSPPTRSRADLAARARRGRARRRRGRGQAGAGGRSLPRPSNDEHRALAAALNRAASAAPSCSARSRSATRAYVELTRSPRCLRELTGASLGLHHRGRQCRRRVPRGRRAASRGGRRGRRRASGCRRAPCWRPGSRPTCCSAASIPANDLAAAPRSAGGRRARSSPSRRICRESLRSVAHVVLPIGTFAETLRHLRERRRALAELGRRRARWWARAARAGRCCACSANLLNAAGFDYVSSEEIREALKLLCAAPAQRRRRGAAAPTQSARRAARRSRERAVGGHTAVPDRRAGARLRVARQDQGRARGPHRALDHVAVGAHCAIGCPA